MKFKPGQKVEHEARGIIVLRQEIRESGNWYADGISRPGHLIVSEDLIKHIKKRRSKR